MLRCCGEGTTPEFGRPGGIPSPGRDTLPEQCSAELHSPSLLYHVLGCSARTALHPRLAQAAAMQVLAEYSTDTCFVWSVRSVSFWGQGHACNTLMSGATVQWSTGLECPGHSWHTINMHRICQVNWVLHRRLSVLLTLCMPSFSTPLSCSHSGFWETPATGVFTDVLYGCIALPPLLHTLLSPCIVLLVTKQAAIHPPPSSAPGLLSFSPSHPAFPSPSDRAE